MWPTWPRPCGLPRASRPKPAGTLRRGASPPVPCWPAMRNSMPGLPGRAAAMPPDGGTLRAEEIATTAALEDLRPEWERLWAQVPGTTPFQTPDWLIPWWRHIGEGVLLTLALRDGAGALIGLLPFYVYASPGTGERSLFPLGIAT